MTATSVPNRNKIILVSALTAAALGVAGLAALAIPAGAGTQPSLPDVSAEDLLSSALAAQPPALAGTVQLDNRLGLPAVPGLPRQALNGTSQARVWFDGQGRARVALPSDMGEKLVVDDGTTIWRWDSAARTATKVPHDAAHAGSPDGVEPAAVARQLLSKVRPTSTVSVDGTATVAGRAAYELVLAPAPTERTLLREVRVAVDGQSRIPLRLEVLANGTNDPVFSVGFDDLSMGRQDASLFTFSPPAGATVTTPDLTGAGKHDGNGPFGGVQPKIVGDGWDTVAVATLPDGLLAGKGIPGKGIPGRSPQGNGSGNGPASGFDPKALLDQFTTPVSGPWGSGHLISTTVVSAIITDDGRVAAGAVPQQVLVEALSR